MAEGWKAERKRVQSILEQHGIELPPEVARLIARESESA